jgi:hypothetical protein
MGKKEKLNFHIKQLSGTKVASDFAAKWKTNVC